MRGVVVFCFLFTACLVHSVPVTEDILKDIIKDKELYPRFIEFGDGDDTVHTVDLDAPIDYELLDDINRNPRNNVYWLYTRNNPDNYHNIVHGYVDSVKSSYFDASKPIVVIAHGWLSTGNTNPNPTVRDAYLNQLDVNIITVDWRHLSLSDYATAVLGVPAVGRGVGQFLVWLNEEFGARFEDMHLIGFSLGAHLVGNAGRETGGRVARVTGLDPAGPLWNLNSNRLSPNDGVYVEAIHTDGGYTVGGLGIGSAIANVDFFPNGGISQPACLTNICNHNRAWELFASTVTYNHLDGNLCSSSLQITLNTCRGVTLNMGHHDLRKTGTSGSYRLSTRRRYPF